MEVKLKKKLISEKAIQKRIKELGKEITNDYEGKDLLILCILKGSIIFTADLVRNIKVPLTVDYLSAKNTRHNSLPDYLKDRDILIVEDIIDSGTTLEKIVKSIGKKEPASLKICTLLYKKECVKNGIIPDYAGFYIGKEFVVGYGLDYNEQMRELPYIAIPEV
ncbi:MAG: hypoxanthine phosphoribosyltransferase [Clostridia bacterium]|nr:hypoxanthine phosphoribosyltransferase [Clostridia bacterium]